ncbi:MAG: class I SAM-dependent methyltransferase [Acidimicrobiales bacterium]
MRRYVTTAEGRHPLPSMASSMALLAAFRYEQSDPDRFYRLLAEDTAALMQLYMPFEGKLILEVGAGPGDLAEAIRTRGGHVLAVDSSWDEMHCRERLLAAAVQADGCQLPLAEDTFDLVCASNVLEHVSDPFSMVTEMLRVVKPGGIVFFNYTTWLSPFGGHETSPWHYLGGARAAKRYLKRHGHMPKNVYGESLFPMGVYRFKKSLASGMGRASIIDAFPRYFPRWMKPVVSMPGLSELLTLNLAVVMRKDGGSWYLDGRSRRGGTSPVDSEVNGGLRERVWRLAGNLGQDRLGTGR